MIVKHQHFDLLQKTVLERLVFHPPIKADASMHNEACFLYAVNGNSKIYGPAQSIPLNTSEGVVMKCGNYLNSWLENTDSRPSEAVAVHFYPEVLKLVFDDKLPDFLISDGSPNDVSIQQVQVDDMVKKYIESLVFYFENPSLLNEELIKLKVKELIFLLVNTDSSNRIKDILKDLFNPDAYDFKAIINKHLFDNLSQEDLALLTNLSLSSFKRKFKEIFNDSPARYIKSQRLNRAAERLKASTDRIADICYECGFEDTAHFSRSFHSQFGMSPSEYRSR